MTLPQRITATGVILVMEEDGAKVVRLKPVAKQITEKKPRVR